MRVTKNKLREEYGKVTETGDAIETSKPAKSKAAASTKPHAHKVTKNKDNGVVKRQKAATKKAAANSVASSKRDMSHDTAMGNGEDDEEDLDEEHNVPVKTEPDLRAAGDEFADDYF